MTKQRKFKFSKHRDVILLHLNPKMLASDVKYKKDIDKSVRKQCKEILKHFQTDGWDLGLDFYVTEILTPIIGRNAEFYIKAKILEVISKRYPKACIKYTRSVSSPLISTGKK